MDQPEQHQPPDVFEDAYSAGRDAATNGANVNNSHFSFFGTPGSTAEWQRGYDEKPAAETAGIAFPPDLQSDYLALWAKLDDRGHRDELARLYKRAVHAINYPAAAELTEDKSDG